MVLINDKKYACATCIKGHRVSGCTHTDRPLFEVKKKGRPATQCQFCRDKRKGGASAGSVHAKCSCGEINQPPQSILLTANGPTTSTGTPIPLTSTAPNPEAAPPANPPAVEVVETKKGVPGSTPTFPNGLRDVHEMAAAAQALSGLGGSGQAAERKLQNLLNPCNCQTTGRCKCCQPKRRQQSPNGTGSGRRTPPRIDTHVQVTNSVIEMFKAKATTTTRASSTDNHSGGSASGSSTPTGVPFGSLRAFNLGITSSATLASPDNRHHPAHTSPHVHKTKLYSPYSTNGNPTPRSGVNKGRSESVSSNHSHGWSGSGSTSGTSAHPAPLPRIRPLADMNKFLGAVFKDDGTVASEIPRSALGLPGIHTFDAMATSGGVKVEPMEIEVDGPVSFPTAEELVIGTCTCGDGCECPGCATHAPRPHSSTSSPKEQQPGGGGGGGAGHECGDSCKSCFDCSDHLSIPSGVVSIEHLIQLAAAKVPPTPRHSRVASELNPHDTSVLPHAAHMSDDAARAYGLVKLKPLECCNGRCQCAPGQCKCESECCGCCTRCLCDEDGDAVMDYDGQPTSDPMAATPPQTSSCCSGRATTPQGTSQTNALLSTQSTASGLSPTQVGHADHQKHHSPARSASSLGPAGSGGGGGAGKTITPPNGNATAAVRRTGSVSRAKEASIGSSSRRVSVSSQSSASGPLQRAHSLGSAAKSSSKSLALHPAHPRPILPKPVSNTGRLAPPRSASGSSRQPSPVHRGSTSSQASVNGSPSSNSVALPVVGGVTDRSVQVAPDAAAGVTSSAGGGVDGGMAIGVDDIATALAASDVDFMAYLNSLLPDGGNVDASTFNMDMSSASSSTSTAAPPDMSLLNIQPAAPVQTPRAADFEASMGDIQELIADALAQQGVLNRQDTNPDAFNYIFNMAANSELISQQPQQPQQPDLSSEASDKQQQMLYYGFDGSGQLGTSVNSLGPMQPPHQQLQQPPDPSFFKPADDNIYTFSGFGFPRQVATHLPSEVRAASRASSQAGSEASSVPVHQPPPLVSQQQPAPAPPPPAPVANNPDIIDLSKPLNPSDVDRILQALLDQQARQAAAAAVDTQSAQSSVHGHDQQQQQQQPHPPPLQRSQASHTSTASDTTSLVDPNASVFDDFLFDPTLAMADLSVVSGQAGGVGPGQDQATMATDPDSEWLRKAWTPDLLGPSNHNS